MGSRVGTTSSCFPSQALGIVSLNPCPAIVCCRVGPPPASPALLVPVEEHVLEGGCSPDAGRAAAAIASGLSPPIRVVPLACSWVRADSIHTMHRNPVRLPSPQTKPFPPPPSQLPCVHPLHPNLISKHGSFKNPFAIPPFRQLKRPPLSHMRPQASTSE